MPTIPNYNPDVQLTSPQGGTVASTETAGRQGALMQGFGQAVGNAADAVYEDNKAKKVQEQNTRNILANAYRQKFVQIAATAEDEAYLNSDAAGNTLVPTFKTKYDKDTGVLTKDIKDPLLKVQVESFRQDAFNDKYAPLLDAKRKMYNEYAVKEFEGQMNVSSGTVLGNPLAFNKEYDNYVSMINGSALTPANKQKAIQLAGDNMAQNAVLGLAQKGEYDTAQAAISGPLSKYIKPDDQIKLMDKVAAIRVRAAETAIKEEDRTLKQNTERLKIINKQYFRERLGTATELIQVGEAKNAATVREFETMLNEDMAAGDLDTTQGTFLKTLVNKQYDQSKKEILEDKGYAASTIYSEIGVSDDLGKVRKKAMDASNSREITPQSTVQILNAIEAEENRRAARARAGKSNKDPKYAVDMQTLNQLYPVSMFGVPDPERVKEGNQARKEYISKYYGKDPKYKGNAEATMQYILKAYNKGAQEKRIPFVPNEYQDISTDEKKAATKAKIMELKGEGKLSPTELAEALKVLMQKEAIKPEKKDKK